MSNPFESDNDSVLEGFLCPICKEDLKSPDRLTAHVENVHSDDQDLLKSFRDIFITAKNRIKRFDENLSIQGSGGGGSSDGSIKPLLSQTIARAALYPQNIVGADCSHMSYFKAIRNPRLERYATETNKLIIRLHKLLTNLPSDPVQRKQHEKNVNIIKEAIYKYMYTIHLHFISHSILLHIHIFNRSYHGWMVNR